MADRDAEITTPERYQRVKIVVFGCIQHCVTGVARWTARRCAAFTGADGLSDGPKTDERICGHDVILPLGNNKLHGRAKNRSESTKGPGPALLAIRFGFLDRKTAAYRVADDM